MTPDGEEPYRPALHFSPRQGWMNDPNGLIRVDGIWHVFFQYYPDGTVHGPMHWGHATSQDLAHWQEQPIALYPDESGTCFSGSAVQTGDGALELFYTAHRLDADGADFQSQFLVHADATLTTFVRDPQNPVVSNPGLPVFRDPKVFWHVDSQRWIMVLTHGQSIGIHSSTDLVAWRLESTFGAQDGRHSEGPWECPDLFPLVAPDGMTLWVLIVGIGSGAYAPGSGTQYFIGDFDGVQFKNINPPELELWLDYGRDFYAAQTFFGAEADAPVALAWMSNWAYARSTPTGRFRGALSLPRELRFARTEVGLRLVGRVPASVASQFYLYPLVGALLVPRTGSYCLIGTLPLAPSQSASISLFGEQSPQIIFSRSGDGIVSLDLHREAREGMDDFGHDYRVSLGHIDDFRIELYVDNGLVELVLNGGATWVTILHFPELPAGAVTLGAALTTIKSSETAVP